MFLGGSRLGFRQVRSGRHFVLAIFLGGGCHTVHPDGLEMVANETSEYLLIHFNLFRDGWLRKLENWLLALYDRWVLNSDPETLIFRMYRPNILNLGVVAYHRLRLLQFYQFWLWGKYRRQWLYLQHKSRQQLPLVQLFPRKSLFLKY